MPDPSASSRFRRSPRDRSTATRAPSGACSWSAETTDDRRARARGHRGAAHGRGLVQIAVPRSILHAALSITPELIGLGLGKAAGKDQLLEAAESIATRS
jgi:hypothetical protein